VQAPDSVISFQQTIPNSAILSQDQTSSPPSSSFMVNDPTAETGDEEPSNQVLSEENQARFREIFSWLQKDARDQVRDVDHFEEMLESIDQELPEDIKASLERISDLDIHYVAIRRALKSQSSRPVLEQKKARAEEAVKGSQARIESNKEMLAKLQSTLELKIARKAALEIELKNLSAEIEADEKKIVELPGLTEKIQEEASAAMTEANQLEAQLFALSSTQRDYQERLENINQIISNDASVIAKYLNI
jgi:predicted RNase H-like nuclease (RuvC/YqgF family)